MAGVGSKVPPVTDGSASAAKSVVGTLASSTTAGVSASSSGSSTHRQCSSFKLISRSRAMPFLHYTNCMLIKTSDDSSTFT